MKKTVLQPELWIWEIPSGRNSQYPTTFMVQHRGVDESPLWFDNHDTAVEALRTLAGFTITRDGKVYEGEFIGHSHYANSVDELMTQVFGAVAEMFEGRIFQPRGVLT